MNISNNQIQKKKKTVKWRGKKLDFSEIWGMKIISEQKAYKVSMKLLIF